jgi:transcriptional regulator with XRE-family HTH domain
MKMFGEIIKQGRENIGYTLKEAAALFQESGIAMSVGYLCDYEKGRVKSAKMDFLYKAAELYGLDSDELCAAAGRVPRDIFNKIIAHPHLYSAIRNLQVKE